MKRSTFILSLIAIPFAPIRLLKALAMPPSSQFAVTWIPWNRLRKSIAGSCPQRMIKEMDELAKYMTISYKNRIYRYY